ncbi:MAG: hypothetical protein LZF63_00370 [Nitrosomonas sp.]|nr:hypothetical protein [Nitrosomonas sp.]
MEKARQNRNQQSASKAAGGYVLQQKHENRGTPEFADNRPETAAQRRLIETMNNSPKAREAAQLKAIMNSSFNSKQIAQRATAIEHTAGSVTVGSPPETQRVGKQMIAILDAADPVVGTATGVQWVWTQKLRNQFYKAGVVRGHLLNHDLGGHAIPENLYPISTKANSDHSARVEQPVKKLLNQAAKNIEKENGSLIKNVEKYYIHYSVTVDEKESNNPINATFNCQFGIGSPTTKESIASNLKVDADHYSASAGLIPGESKVAPLPDWQHKYKFKPETTFVDDTKIKGYDKTLPQPELVKCGSLSHNYPQLLKSALISVNGIVEETKHVTPFATYRIDQDKIQEHLIKTSEFPQALVDYFLDLCGIDSNPSLSEKEKEERTLNLQSTFKNTTKETIKEAAKSISFLKLSRSALKEPYQRITRITKKDDEETCLLLCHVYNAIKLNNKSPSDIKLHLQAKFDPDIKKDKVSSALGKLKSHKLVDHNKKL